MGQVVVVGSLNADLVCFADALPQPGETILGRDFGVLPGGKGANQAVASRLAGATTRMVGAVGDDAHGALLLATLRDHKVDVSGVKVVSSPTGVAVIVVGGGENQIVVTPGANGTLAAQALEGVQLAAGDVVLAQNEVNVETIHAAFALAKANGALAMYNPAPAQDDTRHVLAMADVVIVNETEAAFYAGLDTPPTGDGDYFQAAREAMGLVPHTKLVITLGAQGLVAHDGSDGHDHQNIITIPGRPVVAVDTTGAGDCFCGTLAAHMAAGTPFAQSLERATIAASACVQRRGAIPQPIAV